MQFKRGLSLHLIRSPIAVGTTCWTSIRARLFFILDLGCRPFRRRTSTCRSRIVPAPEGELENAWVFCDVRSWLTGRRLVSLPFSDHCDPLGQSPSDFHDIACYLNRKRQESEWDYVEFRPSQTPPCAFPGFNLGRSFHIYTLDLRYSLEWIFTGFANDSIQRKIRRAEGEGTRFRTLPTLTPAWRIWHCDASFHW
jgi:hypothetical protein